MVGTPASAHWGVLVHSREEAGRVLGVCQEHNEYAGPDCEQQASRRIWVESRRAGGGGRCQAGPAGLCSEAVPLTGSASRQLPCTVTWDVHAQRGASGCLAG